MTNDALVAEAQRAAEHERRATSEFLTLLIEIERRALHLTLGYSSMFGSCTRALRLSESAAFKRITAARAANRYPVILDQLAKGDLTLSSIRSLAAHLTDENVDCLLDAARHTSTREVEQLIAMVHPQPDIPASVRALPAPKTADGDTAQPLALLDGKRQDFVTRAPVAPIPDNPRPVIAPTAPSRYLVKVTVGENTYAKLQQVRALLRHSVPDGDIGEILDRALTLLLLEARRTKWASALRPGLPRVTSVEGRYVPASVRRAVWMRDGGCCAFAGPDGRCQETGFLEFHHVVPFSEGGKTDGDNLELRCRAHNQHEAVTRRASLTRRAASR